MPDLLYNADKVYDASSLTGTSAFRTITSFLRVSPDIFIAGVQKGGTTSLYGALLQHPQIMRSKTKEMFYYGNTPNYNKGKSYYRQFFGTRLYRWRRERTLGKPVYAIDGSTDSFDSTEAPGRIIADVPHAKIIVILRNPVQRAFSQYNFSIKKGFERASFEQALELEQQRIEEGRRHPLASPQHNYAYQRLGYRSRGIYCEHMKNWLANIAPANLHVMSSEEFFEAPQQVFDKLTEFLGLERKKNIVFDKLNQGEGQIMQAGTYKELNDFYKPYNEKLFDMLGKRYNW